MPQASCPRFSGFILHICSLIDSHPIHQSHKNGTRFWMASQPTQKKQHPFSEVFTWFSPAFLTVILHFLHNFPSFSAMRPTCFRAPFPLLSPSFLHGFRLLLALLKILLSKNAKRAQAAACAQNKRLPPLPGRSVLDGRASAGSAPLDHRPVGRPMIRRQRNPPRSGWPTSRRYEPRQRGANPPEIPARLGQKWASPSPGLDSPRQVSYTTPQKTFAWIFPDETNSYPFRHTALSAVWRFLSAGAPRHLPPRR